MDEYIDNPYDATAQQKQWQGWEWGAADALIGYKLKKGDMPCPFGKASSVRRAYIIGYIMMKLHLAVVRRRTIEVIA